MPAAQGTICRIQSASNEAGGSIQGRVPRKGPNLGLSCGLSPVGLDLIPG